MKKRKMSAKQLKYFGPRKTKKKVVKVARYRRARRYYAAARRGYRSRKGLLGGSAGNLLVGAIAGAVSNMIPDFIGGWTKPLVFGAGGYILKKPALLTVAGYEAGKSLMAGGNIFGLGNNTSQGGWL